MTDIKKIVITGGPCGGKSTALSRIEKRFSSLGYHVMFASETATDMITGGAVPWMGCNVEFQAALMTIQRKKEQVYAQWAAQSGCPRVLLVCDRGSLDNRAYMTGREFAKVAEMLGTNEIELRDNYDAVFHLVTAANGAAQFYTTANNTARKESPAEAAALDDKLVAAWTGHPHLRVIDNSTGFDEKISRLLGEIAGFLGVPEPYEIERKFLIVCPDLEMLEKMQNCKKVDIIQTYLRPEGAGEEIRVRQRGAGGHYIFTETLKKRVTDVKRIETERRLTRDEYLAMLMNADTNLKQIRKTRYCLSFSNQYLEVDVYPFWKNKAILEVELTDENQKIIFPQFLKIIKEVTGDERYFNRSLAEKIPEEDDEDDKA
ncbi:MAG: AAA family ATPase [Defluviitaleaceae bacterium]|nr:AAA family ATPase [Defluviitaleaceae bacterium]